MDILPKEIVLALLNWPFLLFIGIAILSFTFRSELSKLITRGGISLVWGDKSFEIAELPEQLNESFAPVADDIEDLKQRLSELEARLETGEVTRSGPPGMDGSPEQNMNAAKERMLKALSEGQYRWRSIERLAAVAGVSKSEAEDVLRPLNEVVFGRGKPDRMIVRLESR